MLGPRTKAVQIQCETATSYSEGNKEVLKSKTNNQKTVDTQQRNRADQSASGKICKYLSNKFIFDYNLKYNVKFMSLYC